MRRTKFEHQFALIDKAIHSDAKTIVIEGRTIPIEITDSGCRTCKVKGITYIEQNRDVAKKHQIADLARDGYNVTWALLSKESWGCMIEGQVVVQQAGKLFGPVPEKVHQKPQTP